MILPPLPDFVALLLPWAKINLRPLPWRTTPNPYHVWLSEIMLQQTRIEAVIPYYHRFLQALPTIKELAKADDEYLLKLWQGLGYYSRARNLKKAAGIIMEQYNGELPYQLSQLLKLPGIGDYTAGAIASIAFGQPTPAVDGNVLRVMTRLLGSEEDIMRQETKKAVAKALQEIYPVGDQASMLTQGLMELGEVICPPGTLPKCQDCPIRSCCYAYKNGKQLQYPVRSPKKTRRVEKRRVYLLCCGDKIALRKREKKGLLAGLWELPNTLQEEAVEATLKAWQISPLSIDRGIESKHIFTHIEWQMQGVVIQTAEVNPSFTWVTPRDIVQTYSVPTAFKAFLTDIIKDKDNP